MIPPNDISPKDTLSNNPSRNDTSLENTSPNGVPFNDNASNTVFLSAAFPLNALILKVTEESPSVRTFFFNLNFETMKPGQFVMVWVRGVDEIPMGLSRKNSITVQKVGEATSKLFELKAGDFFGLRGDLKAI